MCSSFGIYKLFFFNFTLVQMLLCSAAVCTVGKAKDADKLDWSEWIFLARNRRNTSLIQHPDLALSWDELISDLLINVRTPCDSNVGPTWKHWFGLWYKNETDALSPQRQHESPWVTAAAAEVSHLSVSNYLAFILSISQGLTGDTMLITCLISNQVCASEVYFSQVQQARWAAADGIKLTEWTMITTQLQESFASTKWLMNGDVGQRQHQWGKLGLTFTTILLFSFYTFQT